MATVNAIDVSADAATIKTGNRSSKSWRAAAALAIAVGFFAGAMPAHADGITSDQAQQILDELKAIRKAVETNGPAGGQAAAAPDDKVSMTFATGGFSIGKADAPLVLVEYTDYQCPFCQQFHNTAYAQLKANYIDTGKVRFVSRDFPLDFHENSRRGANAARCAAEQGKYWEMRHAMIVNASQLQADKLSNYAANVSIDVKKFQACVDADRFKSAIDKDIAEGTAAGVNGTPSFILGRVSGGKIEGVRLVGAMPYEQFDAKIQELLGQTAKN